jgi:O-antigen ligase
MSQLQRIELLKYSIQYTLENPVFGVGPGQFPDQVWSRAKAVGKRVPSMGTHNTFTQVSSEMGLPALIVYGAVLFTSFQLIFRLYKRTTDQPAMQEINNMAFCLLLILVIYSVSTMFHHVAYSRHLPTLAGLSVALWFNASRRMQALADANSLWPNVPYDQRSRTRPGS